MTAQIERAPAPAPALPLGGSVLLVGNFLSGSVGNRGVCEELADHLIAKGWSVVTTSRYPGRIRRLADMLSTAWSKRREIRVAQIDLFSGPAFLWGAAVCLLLRATKKPYVLTLHGGNLPAFSARWRRVAGALLRSAAAVTAPSGYLLDAMRPLRHDLRLVPNAIDLSRYSFRLRKSVQPRLVWLRAFHRIYDPALAVRVLALLTDEFPDAQLLMIGPDKGDQSYEQTRALADELGVANRVQFVGRVAKAEVPRWINRGDIFLNTSTVDNNPVTVLEAMACGACVVTTGVGGIPYLASHANDALIVDARDAAAMAHNVAEVLRRPELAESLSLNARRRVEKLDWSHVLPMWQSIFHSLAN